jgi:hypothetical protein
MTRRRSLPPRKINPSRASNELFPGEDRDIRREIAKVVDNPEKWLATANDQLGGQKPCDLIGTNREQHLRDLLRAIKHGMPT